MKSILQFFRSASRQESSSDQSSKSINQDLNMKEGISMQYGISMFQESNQSLSVDQQRTMMIAEVALNDLFKKKHFSVCTLDKVMDLLGKGSRNSKAYKQLAALHCVDYSEMPLELKNQIPYMINELLTNNNKNHLATDVCLSGIFDE